MNRHAVVSGRVRFRMFDLRQRFRQDLERVTWSSMVLQQGRDSTPTSAPANTPRQGRVFYRARSLNEVLCTAIHGQLAPVDRYVSAVVQRALRA